MLSPSPWMKQKGLPKFCNNAVELNTGSFFQQANLFNRGHRTLNQKAPYKNFQVLSFYQKFQSPERQGSR